MNIFLQILLVAMLAFGNSTWTDLVDFCLGHPSGTPNPKRIFSRLGIWMKGKYLEWESREDDRVETLIQRLVKENAPAREILRAERIRRQNPYKAMGVCPICSNIWWGFIFWTAIQLTTPIPLAWWWIFLFLPLSSFFFRKIYAKV